MNHLKWLVSVVVVLLIAVVSALLYCLRSDHQLGGDILLPLLAVAGLVCLLVTLILAAIVFAKVGLADKTQALALPEGSVRAVIALGLLIIFAIVAVYLYGSMAQGQTCVKPLIANTKDELTAIEEKAGKADSAFDIVLEIPTTKAATKDSQGKPIPASSGAPYQVYYRLRGSRDAAEFAKQLLTLLGTLVTAVASFYFGTRAVASAMGASSASTPAITSVSPPSIPLPVGTAITHLTLLGSGLNGVKEVKLTRAGANPVVGTVESTTAGAVVCTFQITSTMGGTWDLEVTASGNDLPKRSISIS